MDRINGARTIDIGGGGKRGFRSQNRAAGLDGTEVTALWLNDLQENLARAIEGAGLALAAGDWTLLEKAIARIAVLRAASNLPLDGVVSSPPGAPVEGSQYVVAPNPSGAWAGRAGQIARWLGGAWVYEVPRAGRVSTRWLGGRLITERFDGGSWAEWLATDAAPGPVELATAAETTARGRSDIAVTPESLGPTVASIAGRLINIQLFTASGTYTPTPGTTFALFEGCGGGGAGSGAAAPASGNVSLGAPGGSAASGRARFTAAQIGASRPVSIGAGGAAANASAGANGGTTSLGNLLSFPGGVGGQPFNNSPTPAANGYGAFSSDPAGANISSKLGSTPGYATALNATVAGLYVGPGGDTPYGTGRANGANSNGLPGIGYGSGGSGVAVTAGVGSAAGGFGASGLLIILEYGA